jgi:VWFA-related protein
MNARTTRLLAAVALTGLAMIFGRVAPAGAARQDPAPRQQQQQPPQGRFGENLEVREVQIDAVVTDPRGNVVLGLKPSDFVVEENGHPVDVQDATFYSNRRFLESAERAKALGLDPEQVPSDRYFILFFHDQRDLLPRLTAQILDAGRRAKEWVSSDLTAGDHVAVAGYDYKLKLFQDFTTDRGKILSAIDQAVRGGVEPKVWPSRQEATTGPSLLAHLPTPEQIRKESPRIYGALELLARASAPIPGRKNLLLFSIGFGRVSGFGSYVPDSRYYPPLVHALNDSNVAVYGIDLIPNAPEGGLLDNVLGNSLSSLSADTGGRYFFNFVNFLTPLEQVSDDTSGYYLLSYKSTHPAGTSGYQKVEVHTKNPEFRVRARQGYEYGKKAPTK